MSVLGFEVEWFDPVSNILQTLFLKYFLDNNTIEIIGANKKAFLKRIYIPELNLDDFFIGNTITIHNRLYVIKASANSATTAFLEKTEVRMLSVVRNQGLSTAGVLLAAAKKYRFVMGRVGMVSESIFTEGLQADVSDCIIEFVGKGGASSDFLQFANGLGPASETKQLSCPQISEAIKCCRGMSVGSGDMSLCLIKPHVVKSQMIGEVLNTIKDNGFSVRGLCSIHMTMAVTEEFFDIYRGVFLNYNAMVEHMCAAPCLAVMVQCNDDSRGSGTVEAFREICGPQNPTLGHTLRPESIRALYGTDAIHNAVHCTDLPDDGRSECQYFFETLAGM